MKYKSNATFAVFLIVALLSMNVSADDKDYISFLDGNYTIIPELVETNASYSKDMFDRQNNVTNKTAVILRHRKNQSLDPYKLYFGARAIGTIIHERTNTPGKFPIISRLPPTHTSGNSDTYDVINEISINATAVFPWFTFFAQGEYTEVEYPGQDDKQLRKAFVTFGNLEQAPIYVTIGKKTVNFGDFSSYAPFTHSYNSHYFWAQTDEPLIEAGYITDKTEVAFSLIRNDRGLRVINSPDNNGDFDNWAMNASHIFDVFEDKELKIGGGFLRGTIYDSAFAHHPPATGFNDRSWNSAIDLNATYSGKNFDVMTEYTHTTNEWPATEFHVSALTVQGRYFDEILEFPTTYSVMASQGVQGDDGEEWEKMEQIILGIETDLLPNVQVGAEYMFNHGFVPLILPRVTGDAGVTSHTILVGGKITF